MQIFKTWNIHYAKVLKSFTTNNGYLSTMRPSYRFGGTNIGICIYSLPNLFPHRPSGNLIVFWGKNPATGTAHKPHHGHRTHGSRSCFLWLMSSGNCQGGPPVRKIWKDTNLSEHVKWLDTEATFVLHNLHERFWTNSVFTCNSQARSGRANWWGCHSSVVLNRSSHYMDE